MADGKNLKYTSKPDFIALRIFFLSCNILQVFKIYYKPVVNIRSKIQAKFFYNHFKICIYRKNVKAIFEGIERSNV